MVGVFSLGPHMEEGERETSWVSFIRMLNSFMRAQLS